MLFWRRLISLVAFFFVCLFAFVPSQLLYAENQQYQQSESLTGVWVGILYQAPGGVQAAYPFAMVLEQTQNHVSGVSFITLLNDPSTYGLIELTGGIDGQQFNFVESSIMSHTAEDFRWCIKTGKLRLQGEELNGEWEGDGDCAPGRITIVKVSSDPALLSANNPSTPFAGIWIGILSQSAGGVSPTYPFSMVLSQNGNRITGTSFIGLTDDPSTYGVIELEGDTNGDRLQFTETSILLETAEDFRWCIKRGTLFLDDSTLRGQWSGDGSCSPGEITLRQLH